MHPAQHSAGIVRLVLATSLAATLLAGCGNENGSGASEPAGASSAPMPDTMTAPVVEAGARYTLRQNASITVGVNTVEFDLAFFGRTYGVVDRNTLVGGVQVTVDARPIRGLEP